MKKHENSPLNSTKSPSNPIQNPIKSHKNIVCFQETFLLFRAKRKKTLFAPMAVEILWAASGAVVLSLEAEELQAALAPAWYPKS